MHCKRLMKNVAVVLVASMLTLVACRKEKNTTTTTTTSGATALSGDDNWGYASDAAKLETDNNDVISIVDVAATPGASGLRATSGYPVVTNDTTITPHILTVDFGPINHLSADGRDRKGKILVSYSGRYKDSASMRTISYDSYYVNNIQRTGHKTVTNNGRNSSGDVEYTVIVNDSLIFASDSIISWTGDRTRTWSTGYGTAIRSDDAYYIKGTTILTRANGKVFTHTISVPLYIELSCAYIESGKVTVSSPSFAGVDRTIDYSYGTGGCDNQAKVTIGTKTYVITLR